MWSRDELSRDGPSPRIILSLNIVGKQLTPFGFSAICGRRRLGRWSELLNRTSKPVSLALNVEELKPATGSNHSSQSVSPFIHSLGD